MFYIKNIINFSFEFFLNKKNIFKLIYFNKKNNYNPSNLTITYNEIKVNKKIINYFLNIGIKIFPHLVCKKSIKKFNYLINLYYLNNLKNFLLIKGDEKISNVYYSFNLLNLIKKNYKNFFKIFLGFYSEYHSNCLSTFFELKNNFIKNNFFKKNIFFISQYFYNIDSFYYFFDDLKKISKNLSIVPGFIFINCLKKLIFFSNICKTDLPKWFLKRILINYNKINFININLEIIINLILKILFFKIKLLHFYTMNELFFTNLICEKLNNIINF